MNIKGFKELAKKHPKAVNEVSNEYLKDMIDEIATEFDVNKTVAKYLLMKSINFNVVKTEISEQIYFLDETNGIYES